MKIAPHSCTLFPYIKHCKLLEKNEGKKKERGKKIEPKYI